MVSKLPSVFFRHVKQRSPRRRAVSAVTAAVRDARPSRGATRVNRYRFELSDRQIAAGEHRRKVGSLWDKVGRLQFDYLVGQGLKPDSHLLDVGCGALRGGVHFVAYLQPGHYFGIDLNASLIRAGLEHELPRAGLKGRLPEDHVRVTDTFECDFGQSFDFVLAQSLFTHLSLNHIRLCLYQVAKATEPGARFFATFFEAPEDAAYDQPVRQGKVTTHAYRDSYHYRVSELEWAAGVGPWECLCHGDWEHPRQQKMMEFRRV